MIHLPPLPEWLDRLLDEPYSPEASAQIDRWLAYVEMEFAGVSHE